MDSAEDTDEDYVTGLLPADFVESEKVKEKSIAASLLEYGIEEEIVLVADRLYKEGNTKICRQNKRRYLLFYYTLAANRQLYGDVDPNKIGKIFGLKQGKTMTAVSTFNKKRNLYTADFTSPVNLIRYYCEELGIKNVEIVEEIAELTKSVILKSPQLLNNYPQTIASGVLYYYFQIINYEPNKTMFEVVVGRTTSTIKKMAKIISVIDNT